MLPMQKMRLQSRLKHKKMTIPKVKYVVCLEYMF